jgi:hypothetical protein
LFIDRGQRDPTKGGVFAYHDTKGGISLREHGRRTGATNAARLKPLGKVRAVFHFQ